MKKKNWIFLCALGAFILMSAFLVFKWDAVFQRGNPIPYLAAAARLSDNNAFVAVENTDDIYITKRGNKEALFQMIQDTHDVEFKEQMGSGYLFTDGKKNYTIGSEIYWGRFTVWTLSFDDSFPN